MNNLGLPHTSLAFFCQGGVGDMMSTCYLLSDRGKRSIFYPQPKVILRTLSPPLNGGVFAAWEPYTSVR